MDEKKKEVPCRCSSGYYCHKHQRYRLTKDQLDRVERMGAVASVAKRPQKKHVVEDA